MKTQFLIVWAATIFVTYQLMATKYMTYTFPYMIPLAIGFASYLKKYDAWSSIWPASSWPFT